MAGPPRHLRISDVEPPLSEMGRTCVIEWDRRRSGRENGFIAVPPEKSRMEGGSGSRAAAEEVAAADGNSSAMDSRRGERERRARRGRRRRRKGRRAMDRTKGLERAVHSGQD
jgi:hypothetical protein